jgi:hypothetical protein
MRFGPWKWTEILNDPILSFDEGEAGAPFGGNGFTIPRKWLIAAAVVIAGCFLIVLGALAYKALFPGLARADKEATVTAAFATVVQENLATFRAQPTAMVPSPTPLMAPSETPPPSTTATPLPSATAVPSPTSDAIGARIPGIADASLAQDRRGAVQMAETGTAGAQVRLWGD